MSARSSISSSVGWPILLSIRGQMWANYSMKRLWVLRSMDSWSQSWLASYRFASSRRQDIERTITCLQPPTSLRLPPNFQYSSRAALCQYGTYHDMQLYRPGKPSKTTVIHVNTQQTQIFPQWGFAVPSKKGKTRWPVILLRFGKKCLHRSKDRPIQGKKQINGRLFDPYINPIRKDHESFLIPSEILIPASVYRSECEFRNIEEDEKTVAAMII